MSQRLRGAVTAVYRPEISTQAWLQGLATAVQELLVGQLGTLALIASERDAGGARVYAACAAMAPSLRATLVELWCQRREEWLQGSEDSCESTLTLQAEATCLCRLDRFGIADVWLIGAHQSDGLTIGLMVPVVGATDLDLHRANGGKLLALLATGLRLRQGIALDQPALRRDVVAGHLELIEHGAPLDPSAAVRAWSALLKGDRSLVDRFDTGGRRYLILRNAEAHGGAPELRGRNRRALLLRLAGHPLKLIASELGLSVSSVANAVSKGGRLLARGGISQQQ